MYYVLRNSVLFKNYFIGQNTIRNSYVWLHKGVFNPKNRIFFQGNKISETFHILIQIKHKLKNFVLKR